MIRALQGLAQAFTGGFLGGRRDAITRQYSRLYAKCESPIERAFFQTAWPVLTRYGDFKPQGQVGCYRVDFVLETRAARYAIELDGHDYHSSPEQRANDCYRQNALVEMGYLPIRFTGSQVNRDVVACVKRVREIVEERGNE